MMSGMRFIPFDGIFYHFVRWGSIFPTGALIKCSDISIAVSVDVNKQSGDSYHPIYSELGTTNIYLHSTLLVEHMKNSTLLRPAI